MKATIESISSSIDTEEYVRMKTGGEPDGIVIGSAYPNRRDTDPETSSAKLRALKDADATLYAAKHKIERMITAEEKRLERAKEKRALARGRTAEKSRRKK